MVAAERLAQAVAAEIGHLPAAASWLAEFPPLRASRFPAPRRLPVCDWLPGLAGTLARQLAACADELEWRQTYSAADFGPAFLERYGWSELIGLRGPIASERVACGFLMLGPEVEYPAHAHEAAELYVPLSGEALWMRGESGFVARAPGEVIAYPPWTPHAMRTLSQPLLALYLWRGGDLAAKSKILAP